MVSQCESYYLRDTEIRVNLKPCVLESMKYGANGCIFSALDSSEKKSSCLWYYWFLMYSFFPISFFLSQMDTNHIYCWTANFSLKTLLLTEITLGGPNSLPADCSWMNLFQPPQIYLFGQSKTSLRVSCCSRLHSPSLLLTSGKATEESWAEGGFCMLVKKNNLCQRKVLQQLCCKTCTFQGWAAT